MIVPKHWDGVPRQGTPEAYLQSKMRKWKVMTHQVEDLTLQPTGDSIVERKYEGARVSSLRNTANSFPVAAHLG